MLANVPPSHAVFQSEAYRKDRIPFDVMEKIRQTPTRLESDGRSIVVAAGAPQFPVWVWTADFVDEEELGGLCRHLCHIFGVGRSASFVAKPFVAERIAAAFTAENGAQARFMRLESYACPRVIPARNTSVMPAHPQRAEREALAECWCRFYADCFGTAPDHGDCLREADRFCDGRKSFVIRRGAVVAAMAAATRQTDGCESITHVYTRPEYRGQGFAAALAAHISRLILQEGRTPLLYTDLDNPCSNRAYRNVGFVPRGRVTQVDLRWGR